MKEFLEKVQDTKTKQLSFRCSSLDKSKKPRYNKYEVESKDKDTLCLI